MQASYFLSNKNDGSSSLKKKSHGAYQPSEFVFYCAHQNFLQHRKSDIVKCTFLIVYNENSIFVEICRRLILKRIYAFIQF